MTVSSEPRQETGPEACARLSLPYRERDDRPLYALARVIAEQAVYEWDLLPFHSKVAAADQTYYLLLAKGEREHLQAAGFDICPAELTEPLTSIPSQDKAPGLWVFAQVIAESIGLGWDALPLRVADDDDAEWPEPHKLYYLRCAAEGINLLRSRGYDIRAV